MISSQDIQNMYIDLYTKLRNYIWPIDIVSTIADLEVACYQLFPSVENIKITLMKLKSMCKEQIKEDSEFSQCVEKFEKELNECDGVYNKLTQVREVISV